MLLLCVRRWFYFCIFPSMKRKNVKNKSKRANESRRRRRSLNHPWLVKITFYLLNKLHINIRNWRTDWPIEADSHSLLCILCYSFCSWSDTQHTIRQAIKWRKENRFHGTSTGKDGQRKKIDSRWCRWRVFLLLNSETRHKHCWLWEARSADRRVHLVNRYFRGGSWTPSAVAMKWQIDICFCVRY